MSASLENREVGVERTDLDDLVEETSSWSSAEEDDISQDSQWDAAGHSVQGMTGGAR
ncbi:hypothetical protein [Kineosporia babensis]|uniref:Uncharacterized protein n=1 Tax=Kineosporia babensis TaxID=499548 RepID=A0A9X1NQ99_9ACTN|nr:hypothetical protein [Kineosporia babensis]MCD5317193.1 hypothetical protein [Kineosporia babensis]